MKNSKTFMFLFILMSSSSALSNTWVYTSIDDEWTWVQDYVLGTAIYTLSCEPSFTCEVGTGVFLFDQPYGSCYTFTGKLEITVYGAGSIHARIKKSGIKSNIGIIIGKYTPIKVL
jgi:hypothetical protein